jgi:hypothetical protein
VRGLALEELNQTFGDETAHVVALWQKLLKEDAIKELNNPAARKAIDADETFKRLLEGLKYRLPLNERTGEGSGDVDELTADGLNWQLKKIGAL